jgi:hypothetical protein
VATSDVAGAPRTARRRLPSVCAAGCSASRGGRASGAQAAPTLTSERRAAAAACASGSLLGSPFWGRVGQQGGAAGIVSGRFSVPLLRGRRRQVMPAEPVAAYMPVADPPQLSGRVLVGCQDARQACRRRQRRRRPVRRDGAHAHLWPLGSKTTSAPLTRALAFAMWLMRCCSWRGTSLKASASCS